jgi:hypothetical protein
MISNENISYTKIVALREAYKFIVLIFGMVRCEKNNLKFQQHIMLLELYITF